MAEIRRSPDATAEAELLNHEADGIREYDNPMPFWWSAIFRGTFFFSFAYVLYYMIGVGPGHAQEYDDEVGSFFQEQAARLGDLKPTSGTMGALLEDPKMMQAAAGLFATNCAVCHAKDGGGGTGPNLCDDAYINVKQMTDLYGVISNGVVAKGMPAWDKRFGEAQRVLLASYVAHLRGTKPAAPKAAQGDAIPAWKYVAEPLGKGDAAASATAPAAK